MGTFLLKEGQHVQADPSKPLRDENGKLTGRFEAATFKKGAKVESDIDLAARWPEKFEDVSKAGGADAGRIAQLEAEVARLRAAAQSQPAAPNFEDSAAAPGGQVLEGFQQATGTPQGTLSGPLDPAKAHLVTGGPPPVKGVVKPTGEVKKAPANLDSWTVKDLKEYADDEEIDLKGATHKDEMVKHIRAAHKG